MHRPVAEKTKGKKNIWNRSKITNYSFKWYLTLFLCRCLWIMYIHAKNAMMPIGKNTTSRNKTIPPSVRYTVSVLPSSSILFIRSLELDVLSRVPYRIVCIGGARDVSVDTPHAWQNRAFCGNGAPHCVQNFFWGMCAPESCAKLILRSRGSSQE